MIWNGPLGVFEVEPYQNGTHEIAKIIAEFKNIDKTSIIGGGDTAAAVNKFKLEQKMSHVSTGGGASLEILSGNRLPAIQSLET